MAIRRYTATADATITNAYKANLTSRGDDANMGRSDVLEVFSIYAQAGLSKAAVGSITVDAGAFSDGDTVVLTNSLNEITTFEFDDDSSTTGSNIVVDITSITLAPAQLTKLAEVINETTAAKITASASGSKITLTQDIAGTDGHTSTPDVTSSATTTEVDFAGANDTASEHSRILIKFPIDEIITDRSDDKLPDVGSVNYYLKLFNAPHSSTLPTNYTLSAHQVSSSWEEGHGLDMEEYDDTGALAATGVGVTWNYTSAGSAWTTPGGDYSTTAGDYETTTFEEGYEEMEIDITAIVEDWILNGNNHGLIIKLDNSHEDDTQSFYTKRFFARGTEHFFEKPVIEARWDSSEEDDRANFYAESNLRNNADNTNTILLKNYVNGVLKNIPDPANSENNLSVSDFDLKFYESSLKDIEITSVTAPITNPSTGVYSAAVVIDTSVTTPYACWRTSTPSTATIAFSSGDTAATATIKLLSAAGEIDLQTTTFTLVDSDDASQIFTFNGDNTTNTNGNIGIDGEDLAAMAKSVVDSINDSTVTIGVTASPTTPVADESGDYIITLTQDSGGVAGNTDITGTNIATVINYDSSFADGSNVATAATATIKLLSTAGQTDLEDTTFTLVDSATASQVFTFNGANTTNTSGNIGISNEDLEAMAKSIVDSINDGTVTIGITASPSVPVADGSGDYSITLTQDSIGVDGNTTITGTDLADIIDYDSAFTGGVDTGSIIGEQITLISTDETSIIYTVAAIEDFTALLGPEFSNASGATATATSLAAAIASSGGHGTKIGVVDDGAGELTLTQAVDGSTGNSTITSNLTYVTTPTAFTSGTFYTYHEEYIKVKTREVGSEKLPVYVTAIQNLKNTYSKDETARFRVLARLKDWSPTIYTVATKKLEPEIVEKAYYRVVRVVDDLIVIDYGTETPEYTKLSYDKDGSYFDLDMSMLEPGWSYRIEFKYDINGESHQQPETFKFRVE